MNPLFAKTNRNNPPSWGGLWWLFDEPDLMRSQWSFQANAYVQKIEMEIRDIQREMKTSLPLAKKRLSLLEDAKRGYRDQIRAGARPWISTEQQSPITAPGGALPYTQNIASYEVQFFRDWAWGQAENKISKNIVLRALERQNPKSWLSMGCGGGRLSYDLQAEIKIPETYFLDHNPLILSWAKKLIEGETLALTELPTVPVDLEHTAIRHELHAPQPLQGIQWICSDALNPGFKEKSFDLIFTPWLVDILSVPFLDFAKATNSLINEGGSWVYFGSFAYHTQATADAILPTELEEQLKQAGFDLEHLEDTEIPYLKSPYCRFSRNEKVIAFRARKARHIQQKRTSWIPDWIQDPSRPIPKFQQFADEGLALRIASDTLLAPNGSLSLDQLAPAAARMYGMSEKEALQALQSFFLTKIQRQ